MLLTPTRALRTERFLLLLPDAPCRRPFLDAAHPASGFCPGCQRRQSGHRHVHLTTRVAGDDDCRTQKTGLVAVSIDLH